jgi:hypothetical protein
MDHPVNLRERIATTLDVNADTRRQAELDLKHVSSPYVYADLPSDSS